VRVGGCWVGASGGRRDDRARLVTRCAREVERDQGVYRQIDPLRSGYQFPKKRQEVGRRTVIWDASWTLPNAESRPLQPIDRGRLGSDREVQKAAFGSRERPRDELQIQTPNGRT